MRNKNWEKKKNNKILERLEKERLLAVVNLMENSGDAIKAIREKPENVRILQALKWRINKVVESSSDKRLIFLARFLDEYVNKIWRNMRVEVSYEAGEEGVKICRDLISEIGDRLTKASQYLYEDKKALEYYEEFASLYALYQKKLDEFSEKAERRRGEELVGRLEKPDSLEAEKREAVEVLSESKAVLKSQWSLTSGESSDFFVNLDKTLDSLNFLDKISELYVKEINKIRNNVSKLAFIEKEMGPSAPIFLLHSIAKGSQINSFIVDLKKETDIGKIKGTELSDKDSVAVISDTSTTGETIIRAVDAIRKKGATVQYVVVCFDREVGAKKTLGKADIELRAILTQSDLEKGGMIESYPRHIIPTREEIPIPPSGSTMEWYNKLSKKQLR